MAWATRIAARALQDRKGVTSIEYILIATGVGTVVIACYNAFFERAGSFLGAVTFPA